MSNPLEPGAPEPSAAASESVAPAAAPAAAPVAAPTAARGVNIAVFVGLGLVVVGFLLALIPFIGVIGWPLMIAGLVLGIVGAAKKWAPMWGNILNIVLGFVGPGLAVILVIFGLAAANSGATSTPPAEQPAAEAPAGEASAEETAAEEEPEAEEPAGPSFVDGVLTTDDEIVEITDHRVIQPGDEGNEYGDVPVIAFWCTVTNLSGEKMDPSTAFMFSIDAFQDNDPNIENELSVSSHPDDRLLDNQLKNIKKGGTVKNAIAYELSDETTPVELVASDGLFGGEIGRVTYELK